jgi:lipopolysaccharide transport system ATP-binding protein
MFTKDIASAWARFRGKDDPNSLVTSNSNAHDSNGSDLVWALKDINLEIKRGEILGIIGKNGAGKTTLLKIISRITSPTKGRINISGRTASLIEVGTGFHGELTGRENIYLNGSILGLRKHEIDQRLDKIIDFSGVEKYIDTPVKRYSSGMYVRLGFSVAAHLDPDILIVDEVLAVGDIEFRKKAIGKMSKVSREEGRTILFVSHNMAAITQLCTRTILLEEGRIQLDGPTETVIEKYIVGQSKSSNETENFFRNNVVGKKDVLQLRYVNICQDKYNNLENVDISKDIRIIIGYECLIPNLKPYCNIWLKYGIGTEVLSSCNIPFVSQNIDEWCGKKYPKGLFESEVILPANLLNEGRYLVTPIIADNQAGISTGREIYLLDENIQISFNVIDTGEMRRSGLSENWLGVIRPKLTWNTREVI